MIRSTSLSRIVLSVLFITAIATAPARAAEPSSATVLDRESRRAVEKSLVYLQEEGADWMRDRKCVSCHHGPMMIWAVQEAKSFGYPVDAKVLGEVTGWALGDASKIKAPAPIKPKPTPAKDAVKTSPDSSNRDDASLDMAYIAIAGAAIPSPDRTPGNRAAIEKLRRFLISKQESDGGFAYLDLRPPMGEDREIESLMSALALAPDRGATAEKPESPEVVSARSKAETWLEKTWDPASVTLQARALRLLLAMKSGDLPEKHRAEIDEILKRRNVDGGWSQIPSMLSDAYVTGQALYALSLAGLPGDRLEMAEARAFLIKAQSEEGSWPMVSRPMKVGGSLAKDMHPIEFTATAWATLGLIRSTARPSHSQASRTDDR